MQKLKLEMEYIEYNSIEELSDSDRFLIQKAKKAAENAYAPYSEFLVGAAILLENGIVVIGNNQENAAFPSGMCAERIAVFSVASQYPDIAITTIAITAFSKKYTVNHPIAPCGSCRQVIAEVEKRQNKSIRMLLSGQEGKIIEIMGIETILPFMFSSDELKK